PSSAGPAGPGLLSWDMGSDGSAAHLIEITAGGSRQPTTAETLAAGDHWMKMDGPEVFRRAVRVVVESSNTALARAGLTTADVDWFLPHQANARIVSAAASRLKIPTERCIVNIDRYGNTSAASIPIALAEGAGGEALAVAADVADPAALDGAVKEIESAWGPVQILVNNAGVTRDGLLLRMTDDQWGEVLRTNLDGAFYAIRRVAPGMVRGRFGRIVNIGSASGATGSAGQVNYAAAKAGLLGLTRSVARELASRNVTCNLVAPGPIATAMLGAVSDERQAELTKLVPLARLGT